MLHAKWFVLGAAFFGALVLSDVAKADDLDAAPASKADALAAIESAPDASSTIEAYFRARTIAPRSLAIAQAYVRKMADFGLPETVERQARQVLAVELSDPISLAVVAAMRAKRGQTGDAISGIATAVTFDPGDPFVQRTAGQILAWHDTRSGRMAEDLESTIQTMRVAVGSKPECAEAYRVAKNAYLAARGENEPSAPKPAVASAPPEGTIVSDAVPAEFADDQPDTGILYTTTFAYSCTPCAVWNPCWTTACWSSDWCGASFCVRPIFTVGFGGWWNGHCGYWGGSWYGGHGRSSYGVAWSSGGHGSWSHGSYGHATYGRSGYSSSPRYGRSYGTSSSWNRGSTWRGTSYGGGSTQWRGTYRGNSTYSRGGSTYSRGNSTYSRGGSTFSRGNSTYSRGGSTFSRGGSSSWRGGRSYTH